MEGKVMANTFKRIFENDSLDNETVSPLKDTLEKLEDLFDGLGFCLSEKGDLLSQWRGYAVDGQGFSIGFSKEYLELLSGQREPNEPGFTLRKVIYDPLEQESALMPTYNEFKSEIISGKLKFPHSPGLLSLGDPEAGVRYEREKKRYFETLKAATFKMFGAIHNLYTLKNEAFSEEAEWRLISFLTKGSGDQCLYRASANRLIPYRSFDLKVLDVPAITEVIIGPKNTTPEFVVEKMLEQHGFTGAKVRRSLATYR
jgi:hypothetical protein